MSNKSTAFTALAILSGMTALTLSACNTTVAWKNFSSTPGKYSVSMPGTPKEEKKSLPLPNGKALELQGVQLQMQDEEYAVAFVDFPSNVQIPAGQSQLLMTGMIKGLTNRLADGKISNEKELEISGVPCREFKATGKDQSKEVNLAGRVCLADQRLYQVLARSEKAGKTFDENTSKFLTSFKITDKS